AILVAPRRAAAYAPAIARRRAFHFISWRFIMGQAGTNVPAAIATGLIGLALGVGLGVVGMVSFGRYRLPEEMVGSSEPPADGPGAATKGKGGPPGGMNPMAM